MAHSLTESFDTALESFTQLENTTESTQSPEIQTAIKRLINSLEEITNWVSVMDLFSSNEVFNEMPTDNIKFLLLPALLGTLTSKLCEPGNRMHLISVSETYFLDFINRLKSYGLIDIEIPYQKDSEEQDVNSMQSRKSEVELIADMVIKRNTKIRRYQERKELSEKLRLMKENSNQPHVDEETKRDYFVTLLRIFANQAVDELISLAAERPLVQHMRSADGTTSSTRMEGGTSASWVSTQPVIITRDTIQKEVYGLGYPSIPVMSVQEFYDQRDREGGWPKQQRNGDLELRNSIQSCHVPSENSQEDINDAEEGDQIEGDDPETLARLRQMDEYKDRHRRGWGNRSNRS